MRCNLNFNQCYLSPYYPEPIFTCRRNILLAILNSTNVVINPTTAFALLSSATTQTVADDGNIVTTFIAGSGNSVNVDGGGNITLSPGTYRVSYTVMATLPAGGNMSSALYLNGTEVSSSQSTATGTAGNAGVLVNTSTITIPAGGGTLRLVNTSGDSLTVNATNIVITKIG